MELTLDDLDLSSIGTTSTNVQLTIDDLDLSNTESMVDQTSKLSSSFIEQASQAPRLAMTEESKLAEERNRRVQAIKAGDYGEESIIDKFNKLTMSEEAYRDMKLSEAMKYGKEEVEFAGGDPRAQDFTKGVAATTYGMQLAGLDLNTAIGLEQPEKRKQVEDKIAAINDSIKDKDFFSSATLGRIVPTLITLPVNYQSKLAAALIEGSLSYGEARGSGMSVGEAGLTGIITGGATAGIMKLIDSLGVGANRELFNYMKEHNNITDDEAEEIFTKWSQVNETDGSFGDRTKAIVDSLGEKGAVLTKEAASYSPEATKVVEGNVKARRKLVEDTLKGEFDVTTFANDINKGIDIVKGNYSVVKEQISNNVVKPLKTGIPDALDELTAGDARAAKELLAKEDLQVADLVDAMPHVNSMIRKSKGVTKNNWVNVKNEVEANLKRSLSKKEFNDWKVVNNDYMKMVEAKESALGKTILKTISSSKDQITPKAAVQKFRNLDVGDTTFKNLEFLVGTNKVAKLEKEVIKSALGKAQEDIDWLHITKNLDKKGFITEEGKAIQKLIDDISISFATDDALRAIMYQNRGVEAGFSDSLIAKAKYLLIGKMFKFLTKRIPFDDNSKYLRMMDELADVLAKPDRLRKFETQIERLSPPVKQKMLEDTIKQLEWKPENPDNIHEPWIATERGTVGKDASKVALSDAQTDYVRNSLKTVGLETEEAINKVQKMVSDNRFNSILTNTRNKLNVDDLRKNTQMINKTIESEANVLIGRIEKSLGVKMPKKEAEKIVMNKMKEILDACK